MTDFLQSLTVELQEEILGYCVERGFAEEECVFSKGETARFLPIVFKGRVKLVRYPEDGKEVIIGIFADGQVFAIPPALDGKRFPATAIAMEPTNIGFLDRRRFISLMKESEEFSSAILGQMCGLLRDRTATVQIHSTQSSETRVGKILLKLARDSRQEWPVRIALRRQDIAEMAGLTTETTIRAVRRLADKGLVRIVHGKILIDCVEALERYSG